MFQEFPIVPNDDFMVHRAGMHVVKANTACGQSRLAQWLFLARATWCPVLEGINICHP